MTLTEAHITSLDLAELVCEIERYLDAVDCFRSEGCEPRWSSGAGVPCEVLAPGAFAQLHEEVV